jgi:hypothetical protein
MRSSAQSLTSFVSNLADTRRQVLASGAVRFLSKPFGKKSMIDCLKTVLIRRDAMSFAIKREKLDRLSRETPTCDALCA